MIHDSEADHRDQARTGAIESAVDAATTAIMAGCATGTYAERMYLQVAVAQRLLNGVRLETMSALYREEIQAAEKKIDDGG